MLSTCWHCGYQINGWRELAMATKTAWVQDQGRHCDALVPVHRGCREAVLAGARLGALRRSQHTLWDVERLLDDLTEAIQRLP